jgi:predicted transcriptional regulator
MSESLIYWKTSITKESCQCYTRCPPAAVTLGVNTVYELVRLAVRCQKATCRPFAQGPTGPLTRGVRTTAAELLDSGLSVERVADLTGASYYSISRLSSDRGRKPRRSDAQLGDEEIGMIAHLAGAGLSRHEVADTIGYSYSAVVRAWPQPQPERR